MFLRSEYHFFQRICYLSDPFCEYDDYEIEDDMHPKNENFLELHTNVSREIEGDHRGSKLEDAVWIECKKRSEVWKHFLIDKNNKCGVKCKKCPTILAYTSSTTNMWRHLEGSHLMNTTSKKHSPGAPMIYPHGDIQSNC